MAKKKDGDFKRRTQKVGKKKLLPVNETKIDVKFGSLDAFRQIPNFETIDDAKVTSFKEALVHTKHHNTQKRREALILLHQMIAKNPRFLLTEGSSVFATFSEKLVDLESSVRGILLPVFTSALSLISPKASSAYIHIINVFMLSALTKLHISIRLDALAHLVEFSRVCPENIEAIVPNFMPSIVGLLEPSLHAVSTISLLGGLVPPAYQLGSIVNEKSSGSGIESLAPHLRRKMISVEARLAVVYALRRLLLGGSDKHCGEASSIPYESMVQDMFPTVQVLDPLTAQESIVSDFSRFEENNVASESRQMLPTANAATSVFASESSLEFSGNDALHIGLAFLDQSSPNSSHYPPTLLQSLLAMQPTLTPPKYISFPGSNTKGLSTPPPPSSSSSFSVSKAYSVSSTTSNNAPPPRPTMHLPTPLACTAAAHLVGLWNECGPADAETPVPALRRLALIAHTLRLVLQASDILSQADHKQLRSILDGTAPGPNAAQAAPSATPAPSNSTGLASRQGALILSAAAGTGSTHQETSLWSSLLTATKAAELDHSELSTLSIRAVHQYALSGYPLYPPDTTRAGTSEQESVRRMLDLRLAELACLLLPSADALAAFGVVTGVAVGTGANDEENESGIEEKDENPFEMLHSLPEELTNATASGTVNNTVVQQSGTGAAPGTKVLKFNASGQLVQPADSKGSNKSRKRPRSDKQQQQHQQHVESTHDAGTNPTPPSTQPHLPRGLRQSLRSGLMAHTRHLASLFAQAEVLLILPVEETAALLKQLLPLLSALLPYLPTVPGGLRLLDTFTTRYNALPLTHPLRDPSVQFIADTILRFREALPTETTLAPPMSTPTMGSAKRKVFTLPPRYFRDWLQTLPRVLYALSTSPPTRYVPVAQTVFSLFLHLLRTTPVHSPTMGILRESLRYFVPLLYTTRNPPASAPDASPIPVYGVARQYPPALLRSLLHVFAHGGAAALTPAIRRAIGVLTRDPLLLPELRSLCFEVGFETLFAEWTEELPAFYSQVQKISEDSEQRIPANTADSTLQRLPNSLAHMLSFCLSTLLGRDVSVSPLDTGVQIVAKPPSRADAGCEIPPTIHTNTEVFSLLGVEHLSDGNQSVYAQAMHCIAPYLFRVMSSIPHAYFTTNQEVLSLLSKLFYQLCDTLTLQRFLSTRALQCTRADATPSTTPSPTAQEVQAASLRVQPLPTFPSAANPHLFLWILHNLTLQEACVLLHMLLPALSIARTRAQGSSAPSSTQACHFLLDTTAVEGLSLPVQELLHAALYRVAMADGGQHVNNTSAYAAPSEPTFVDSSIRITSNNSAHHESTLSPSVPSATASPTALLRKLSGHPMHGSATTKAGLQLVQHFAAHGSAMSYVLRSIQQALEILLLRVEKLVLLDKDDKLSHEEKVENLDQNMVGPAFFAQLVPLIRTCNVLLESMEITSAEWKEPINDLLHLVEQTIELASKHLNLYVPVFKSIHDLSTFETFTSILRIVKSRIGDNELVP